MEECRGESLEVNEHTRTRMRTRTSLPARENEREGTSGIDFASLLLCFFAVSENFHRNEGGWSAPQWREED